MGLTYRNDVSIAELVVYIPALLIAIYLAYRHGTSKSSGWLYLIMFSLARIIGPIMQLLTISNSQNASLYIGSAILAVIGLSPLQLATIGLLTRLLSSIHKSYNTFLRASYFYVMHIIIVVGLVLSIVGGINAGDGFEKTEQYHPGSLNKIGTALLIVSYILIIVFTALLAPFVRHAEKGEKRIFIAVVIALPLMLVRVIYSAFSTFSKNPKFNILTGNTTLFLCLALVEEFIIVVIYEGIGLTLSKQPMEQRSYGEAQTQQWRPMNSSDSSSPMQAKQPQQHQPQQESVVLRILKKTIIGRIVMAVIGGNKNGNRDIEMQQGGRR